MLLDEDVTTDQEHHARFLTKLWQLARNVLQVTCRRFHNVSWTCCKSLEEDGTTYQEHLASYLTQSLQCIRKVVQVMCLQVGRCCKYQERLACYLAKMLQHIRNIFQVTWRKVYNLSGRSCKLMTSRKMLQVSGTSCMLLDEDVTTYKEHLSSFLKKMWQRARNVLQVTCWTFHSVSGTCCKSLEEDVTTY